MLSSRLLFAAAAAALLVAAKAPEERRISYKMKPVLMEDGSRALEVDMRFRGDADGETILHLPGEWAGAGELWRHVKALSIRGAKRLSGYYADPIIHHRPGARIRVRYRVVSAWAEDPAFAYQKARPLVRPDWFFAHGEGLFATPDGREAAPARFRWGKLPKGWRVASDLDHLRRHPSTLANLVNSVVIGGTELKVVERTIGRAPLRVATLGKWTFETEELADTVAPIVAAADSYWGEESAPFLIAMAPIGDPPAGLSYTGTSRTDGFSIASTSAFPLATAERFLAHEYLHSWIPIMLGAMPAEEGLDQWFSEGFSDYVAAKLLLRAGLWTLEEYAADKNEMLLRYGTSPVRAAPASEVSARFWEDPHLQQLSYDRGHLIAARIDAAIAAATNGAESLDTVLRAQRRIADGSPELATELFRRTVKERAGIDLADEIARHARGGEPVLLAADLFGPCARIGAETRKAFDRGFDLAATQADEGLIHGVDPEGPAYAAGMRDEMVLVDRVAGKPGDSSVELAYRVLGDNGLQVIRYLPQGKAEHEVQRMELTVAGPDEEKMCIARLGGGPA